MSYRKISKFQAPNWQFVSFWNIHFHAKEVLGCPKEVLGRPKEVLGCPIDNGLFHLLVNGAGDPLIRSPERSKKSGRKAHPSPKSQKSGSNKGITTFSHRFLAESFNVSNVGEVDLCAIHPAGIGQSQREVPKRARKNQCWVWNSCFFFVMFYFLCSFKSLLNHDLRWYFLHATLL